MIYKQAAAAINVTGVESKPLTGPYSLSSVRKWHRCTPLCPHGHLLCASLYGAPRGPPWEVRWPGEDSGLQPVPGRRHWHHRMHGGSHRWGALRDRRHLAIVAKVLRGLGGGWHACAEAAQHVPQGAPRRRPRGTELGQQPAALARRQQLGTSTPRVRVWTGMLHTHIHSLTHTHIFKQYKHTQTSLWCRVNVWTVTRLHIYIHTVPKDPHMCIHTHTPTHTYIWTLKKRCLLVYANTDITNTYTHTDINQPQLTYTGSMWLATYTQYKLNVDVTLILRHFLCNSHTHKHTHIHTHSCRVGITSFLTHATHTQIPYFCTTLILCKCLWHSN